MTFRKAGRYNELKVFVINIRIKLNMSPPKISPILSIKYTSPIFNFLFSDENNVHASVSKQPDIKQYGSKIIGRYKNKTLTSIIAPGMEMTFRNNLKKRI